MTHHNAIIRTSFASWGNSDISLSLIIRTAFMKLRILNPVFNLPDGVTDTVKEYMQKCVELTATEPKTDCAYYGWDVSKDGKLLYCREAYTSAEALVNHLNNAGPTVGEMIEKCGLSIKQFEVICNEEDLPTLEGPCGAFGAEYRINSMGFDNGYSG